MRSVENVASLLPGDRVCVTGRVRHELDGDHRAQVAAEPEYAEAAPLITLQNFWGVVVEADDAPDPLPNRADDGDEGLSLDLAPNPDRHQFDPSGRGLVRFRASRIEGISHDDGE